MHEGDINLKMGYKSNHEQNSKTASKNTTTNSLITAHLTSTLQSQQAHSYNNNNKLQSCHATKSQRNDSPCLEMCSVTEPIRGKAALKNGFS